MAKQEFEFTLVFSGVPALTRPVLDAFYEAGCDDALIGMRDGVAFAEFCRAADSFPKAVLSAIRAVEGAGVGAKVEHIEPDELVTMSEIARRLHQSREGVRKRVAGLRGPGNFPPPVGGLTQRSPLWRWSDVVAWHEQQRDAGLVKKPSPKKRKRTLTIANGLGSSGSPIPAFNAALELRRRVPLAEAMQILRLIGHRTSAAN